MAAPLQPDRRTLLKSLVWVAGGTILATRSAHAQAPLPVWRHGELDIHHIDTGRGNCTLLIFPDGTTLMVDAGAANAPAETSSQPRPNATRRPGEWQARYALRHAPNPRLDFFLATHIHPDHIGDLNDLNPLDPSGAFRLTGISDVDHLLPITTVIDRGFPGYGTAHPSPAPFATNYLAFLKSRTARTPESTRTVESARIGATDQIRLAHPSQYPTFQARILSANGAVWTGHGMQTTSALPNIDAIPTNAHGYENILSISLRLQYGLFSYFTGGDLTFDTHDGRLPWMDVESPVTRIAGRTEVAVADHHGYFDACGPNFARNLDAQAYIIPAWDIGHPGSLQMQRLLGAWDQDKATHDVFATDLLPQNALLNRRFAPQLKSRRGHIVVRVAPGGNTYRIFILDSSTENDLVTATSGPNHCRS